ncbi:MAG: TIGR03960 family B12-binding radical SAM protein [Desulfovibrio sp.]|jgi:radical SAM family uncharacterized protein/radical SAM-linked protein|nr:TIGR03960 family B12-binding radical SAM protein [Desulfovibrio sp.]
MRELLPLFPKPSRYTGIEEGVCRKNPARIRLRLALAFPDTYEVGMSYLGQKILYSIVNDNPDWWAERVMAPEREAGDILRAHNAPLCTLESDTPLKNLHCLAFSITHELCYTNVLYMLDLAGIPLRAANRGDSLTDCPLVIAGGGALLSAEPLTPFVDLMALGDGEEVLPELLRLLQNSLSGGKSKTDFLREAALLPGIYAPSLFAPDEQAPPEHKGLPLRPLPQNLPRPARRIVADLNSAPYPARQVTPVGAIHNRLALEIARGCTRGCRFCHAGMVYRPARERSLENISALLYDCLRQTGFDEISFLSLSAGDFSALKTLCMTTLEHCAREQIGLSLPSLRVGSVDDEIIERMADLRRTGVTLAPEAGSQRLRDIINKGVSEEDLLLHAQKLLEHGWRQVKLYFMIGLPKETDDDLAAIADLCRKTRDAAGRGNARLQVTAALSPFVPKPFTPFQWEGQISVEEIRRRVGLVKSLFKGQKGLALRWREPDVSHLEGILSRAGREMADVVEKAYHKGAVFCSWTEHFDLAPWVMALAECGISADECIGPKVSPLPWSHLEAGVSEEFLLRERNRALNDDISEKLSADCRYGACLNCGVCDTKTRPSRLPRTGSAGQHKNRLNFLTRDQKSNAPTRDANGQLLCRAKKSAPPQIAPHLTIKAAQYRIWHTKLDESAYLSQLDLQALFYRALRRANLPLAFSRGFHPLPLISFGRALPVGVQSRAEWFALTLHSSLSSLEVSAQLTPCLPPGIDIVRVETIGKIGRTEQSQAETFVVTLPASEECLAAARAFEAFAAKTAFPYMRKTKNGLRSTDIRPLLRSFAPTSDAVTFVTDWRMNYMSPLSLCLAILDQSESCPRSGLRLIKTGQFFADGRMYP